MPWEIQIRASEDPEEWVPLRKPGGSTLKVETGDQAQDIARKQQQQQPHIPVRVVPIYG